MNTLNALVALFCFVGVTLEGAGSKVLHSDIDVRAPFYALPMSGTDCEKTYQLIDKMGNKPWYDLMWNKKKMEKLGDEVDHVHPLRFAGFIFANHHLKNSMRKVRAFGMKWSRFIDGFGGKMNRNADQNNLLMHIPGFCHQTGADPVKVEECIRVRNWAALLSHCIDR